MKEKLMEKITILINFTTSMQALNDNPYSSGINNEKLFVDLLSFEREMSDIIATIDEEADEKEQSNSATSEE